MKRMEGVLDFISNTYSSKLNNLPIKENKVIQDNTLCSCCRGNIDLKNDNISFLCDDNNEVFVVHNNCKVYFLIKLV